MTPRAADPAMTLKKSGGRASSLPLRGGPKSCHIPKFLFWNVNQFLQENGKFLKEFKLKCFDFILYLKYVFKYFIVQIVLLKRFI
jgi:hypothetical protein